MDITLLPSGFLQLRLDESDEVDELLANGHVDFPAAPALELEATPATSVTDPSVRRRRSL